MFVLLRRTFVKVFLLKISYAMTTQELIEVNVKPLRLTDSALGHEDVGGSGCIDPRFLDLSTNWR
jgi:hypothetical protein